MNQIFFFNQLAKFFIPALLGLRGLRINKISTFDLFKSQLEESNAHFWWWRLEAAD